MTGEKLSTPIQQCEVRKIDFARTIGVSYAFLPDS